MMTFEIDAVYQQGSLKLLGDLPLQDGQTVHVVVRPQRGAVARLSGLITWSGPSEDLGRYLHDPEEGILGSHDV